ncbi:uL30 family ribosomal protein [Candidatus Woesearchaeota archaeon]|nr:uL30 family ribosomal protein [Candidatus Woesearchaeota archaeon]
MAETKQKQEQAKVTKAPVKAAASAGKIIVVRVRGRVRLLTTIKNTLDMLRLYKTNFCVILDNTPVNMGMIQKAKDYITWGEADSATVEELFSKRGTEYTGPLTDTKGKITYTGRYVEHKGKKYNKYFKLNPPHGGYGRKGIKTHFHMGGALGDRAEKISDLVKRML